jgi:hypothetical protein
MPIEYVIDHEKRLVKAGGHGTITGEEIFSYQREAWSRPDVAGYDELVDFTGVERIDSPSPEGVIQLARLSAGMDAPSASRFAIVAPRDLAFGLGRMYQAFRGLEPGSTKEVRVFRTLAGALAYLDVPDEGKPDPRGPSRASEETNHARQSHPPDRASDPS